MGNVNNPLASKFACKVENNLPGVAFHTKGKKSNMFPDDFSILTSGSTV